MKKLPLIIAFSVIVKGMLDELAKRATWIFAKTDAAWLSEDALNVIPNASRSVRTKLVAIPHVKTVNGTKTLLCLASGGPDLLTKLK
jgi:hypothetical protein